jgi:hypothetical protein
MWPWQQWLQIQWNSKIGKTFINKENNLIPISCEYGIVLAITQVVGNGKKLLKFQNYRSR